MTLLFTLVLLGLVLEHYDLRALNLAYNLTFNLSALNYGSTDLGSVLVTEK